MADDRELGHARGTAAELAQALPASSWTKLSADWVPRGAGLRLGAHSSPALAASTTGALAARPAQSKGSDRLRVLRGLRPTETPLSDSRVSRVSAGPSRNAPGRQRRSRARSLRGAQLARLASPRHARHAGPRLPHGDARRGRPRKLRQTEQKESHTHVARSSRSPSRRSAP